MCRHRVPSGSLREVGREGTHSCGRDRHTGAGSTLCQVTPRRVPTPAERRATSPVGVTSLRERTANGCGRSLSSLPAPGMWARRPRPEARSAERPGPVRMRGMTGRTNARSKGSSSSREPRRTTPRLLMPWPRWSRVSRRTRGPVRPGTACCRGAHRPLARAARLRRPPGRPWPGSVTARAPADGRGRDARKVSRLRAEDRHAPAGRRRGPRGGRRRRRCRRGAPGGAVRR